jgi:hypothetical protein
MIVFSSNILTSVIILLIAMILNGDLGTKKIPFCGSLSHHRFIQQPYCLFYFFIVSSFYEVMPNSINGLLLFFFLLVFQIGLVILVVCKFYRKNWIDWSNYLSRLKQIIVKILDKKPNQKVANLTLQDITYFLQNLIFPSVFMLSNAYLIVKLIFN